MDIKAKKESILSKLEEYNISLDSLIPHHELFRTYCCISDVFLKEIFKEDYSKNLKTHDLISHFENMEKQYGPSYEMIYQAVIKDMKELSAYIKTSSSGNYGERVVNKALKRLKCKSLLLIFS